MRVFRSGLPDPDVHSGYERRRNNPFAFRSFKHSPKARRLRSSAAPPPSPADVPDVSPSGESEVLLVHARNFRDDHYGLVAGFVETGETLEEAVHREVMEETGLHIKNLRYFGSQPWPYPCGLMVGYRADYDSGRIHLQRSELNKGAWFDRHHLPHIPEKLSIARQLIDAWLEEEAGIAKNDERQQ